MINNRQQSLYTFPSTESKTYSRQNATAADQALPLPNQSNPKKSAARALLALAPIFLGASALRSVTLSARDSMRSPKQLNPQPARALADITISEKGTYNVRFNQSYPFINLETDATLNLFLSNLDGIEVSIDNDSRSDIEVTLACPNTDAQSDCQPPESFKIRARNIGNSIGYAIFTPGPVSLKLTNKPSFGSLGQGAIQFNPVPRTIAAIEGTPPDLSNSLYDGWPIQPGETFADQNLKQPGCYKVFLCEPQEITLSLTGNGQRIESKAMFFSSSDQLSGPNQLVSTLGDPSLLIENEDGSFSNTFAMPAGENQFCALGSERLTLGLDADVSVSSNLDSNCDLVAYFDWFAPATTPAPTQKASASPSAAPSISATLSPTPQPSTSESTSPTTEQSSQPTTAQTIQPNTQPSLAPISTLTNAPTVSEGSNQTAAPTDLAQTTQPSVSPISVTPTIRTTPSPTTSLLENLPTPAVTQAPSTQATQATTLESTPTVSPSDTQSLRPSLRSVAPSSLATSTVTSPAPTTSSSSTGMPTFTGITTTFAPTARSSSAAKQAKAGMSTGAKAGIALGAIGAVSAAALLALKRRPANRQGS